MTTNESKPDNMAPCETESCLFYWRPGSEITPERAFMCATCDRVRIHDRFMDINKLFESLANGNGK